MTFLRTLTATGWLALALAASVVLTLGYCSWDANRDAKAAAALAQANARTQARQTVARDAAADQRLSDAKSNAQLEKDLTHAVSSLPDAVPSARRVALACERLRQQGARDGDLPAECRPSR